MSVGLTFLGVSLMALTALLVMFSIVWYSYDITHSLVHNPKRVLREFDVSRTRRIAMWCAIKMFEVRIVHNAIQDSYTVECRSLPTGWTTVTHVGKTFDTAGSASIHDRAVMIAEDLITQAHVWLDTTKTPVRTVVKTFDVSTPGSHSTEETK